MGVHSFSFCLPVKLLIPPLYLNEILAGYSNLGCRFFSFITLNMSAIPFWTGEFLLKDQLLSLWESLCCFSLAAFNICSLCLIFVNLINMCLGVFHLGFILLDSLSSLDLGDHFLPRFREVLNYYLLKYFLMVFLFVFFFWNSYDSNVGVFDIVPEVSEVVLISFNSFFIFPLGFIYF